MAETLTGVNQECRFVQCNGLFYFIADGAMAELAFKTLEDVQDFNRRLAAAGTQEERQRVIRSIMVNVVPTQ